MYTHMPAYIHIYTYIYVFISTYTYVYIYIYNAVMSVGVHECTKVHVCIYLYVHIQGSLPGHYGVATFQKDR